MIQQGNGLLRSILLPVLAALLLATAPARAESPAAADSAIAARAEADREADKGQEIIHSHAIAMHGAPKYRADFRHFAYVNPDAPKGGFVKQAVTGTFDSFNPFIPKGNPAAHSTAGLETLMTASADEPFTRYGLIAESVTYPKDRSWITFHLRPEARWHDGLPITADDVVFSFNILMKEGQPFYRFYYRDVASVTADDPHTVTYRFKTNKNPELALIVGELPVLPKHYWQGRDFSKTTLEPPLGSGPYKIVAFEPGRYTVVERVKDYWGRDLPVNRGQDNFDRMRHDYYRDQTVIREAIKAGDIDYYTENQAKAWAQDFNIEAVRKGWLKKEEIHHNRPAGMQAFVMNLRRPVFQNIAVREALAYAFDFEWSNKNLFFGQYERSNSFFSNSELAAKGMPSPEELKILEPFRSRLAPEVFGPADTPPTTDGSGWPRDNLRKAFKLLFQAGYEVRDLKMVNKATGEPLRFEMLLRAGGSAFRRIVLPMQRNLARLGITMTIREVDDAQYINRIRARDFDMIVGGWGQSDSPGNEQRAMWSSEAADLPSSRNYAGLKDPVVDALVEEIITAPDRESLVNRTRALDRVLRSHHFVIPNWYLSVDRILYWDKFSRPRVTPDSGTSLSYWWWDEAKAERLAAERGKTTN
ncbi:MAG: ABC transporter substrate-binding protein [Alphaproteobacteria bacterium]|nr:ABC transporter substrate-binding protein [Alphaproteobacteria bacterium]MCB9930504.1 ABC transporter substrate-binding protein [Alphaproteobacteria bacterium]